MADTSPAAPSRNAVPFGSLDYNAIAQFLTEEALLLDDNRLLEWKERLTEDISYSAPIRVSRWNDDAAGSIDRSGQHFLDDYASISLRIRRLTESKNVWTSNPQYRTRRFISNILVWETPDPDEFSVTSYLLLMRNKLESPHYETVTGCRDDRIRRVDGALKLARREFIIDMSVLGVPNLISFV